MARRGKRMTGESQIEARLSALRQDLEDWSRLVKDTGVQLD